MKRVPLYLILLLVACRPSVPVYNDFNPTVDFSTYDSFSFDTQSVSGREGSVAHDPRVMNVILETISEDLRARPMTEAGSGGDISISVTVAVGEETGVDQWGVTFDSSGEGSVGQSFQYKSGTLVIDFFDNATGQLIWRGWAESAVSRTSDPDLEALAQIVRATLAQYPPSPEED